MRKILLTLLFLLISAPSFAATYYINSSTGNDSNPGTSGSPFASAAPISVKNFLNPGDIVNIASGTTYTGNNCTMQINSSGVFGLPITINGVGTTPVFNCATSTASIVGWTGWTLYAAKYTFTIPSSSVTVGAIYSTPNGNQFTVSSTIVSSTTLTATGVGAPNAASNTLTLVSGTGPGTLAYSATATKYATYVSNIVVPFTVQGVIVDGTYNLIFRPSGLVNAVNNLYYQSGGQVYVDLPDNSAPGGHTIEFAGQYGGNGTVGIISTGGVNGGDYVTFNNLETYGATSSGILSINRWDTWNNNTENFSGYASVYCATHLQPPGCTSNVFSNNSANYSNGSASQGGNGENVVIEGSYNVYINGTISNGIMAGYDDIAYATDTPAQYNQIINTTLTGNSSRSLQNSDNQGFDPYGIYCDGCAYLQAINVTINGNSANANYQPHQTQNAVVGIQLSTEHPTTNIPHDVYIHNVNVSQGNFLAIETTVLSGGTTPWYNVWIDGSTFYSDSNNGGFLASFKDFNTSLGQTLHLYNNIFFQNGAAGNSTISFTGGTVDSNNNDFYGGGSNIITVAGTAYSLSGWQTLSSQDANSIASNPFFISTTVPYNFLLQRVALGQANTSPAIGIGSGTWQNTFYNITSNGTTRSDSAIDTANTDIGYHSLLTYGSSISFPPNTQSGTDIY